MTRIMMVLGMVLLGGCAGVGEMREEAPVATFLSSKSPDVLAACVSEAWTLQKILYMTPDVRINPISGGKQVMIYNSSSASPNAFADMRQVGSTTEIKYYSNYAKMFKREFPDLIKGCL